MGLGTNIIMGLLTATAVLLSVIITTEEVAYGQTMQELLQQAEEYDRQKALNNTGGTAATTTAMANATAARLEIERLMAEDPEFMNFENITTECMQGLIGNSTANIPQLQCMSTIQEATDKWCGLEQYHARKMSVCQ